MSKFNSLTLFQVELYCIIIIPFGILSADISGINNNKINLELSQNYEFTDNSNYHIEQGNSNNLSDLLGIASYTTEKFVTNYDLRYDFNDNFLKSQSLNINQKTKLGTIDLLYLDEKSKTNDIITTDTESLNYSFSSEKFSNFSNKIIYIQVKDLPDGEDPYLRVTPLLQKCEVYQIIMVVHLFGTGLKNTFSRWTFLPLIT